MWETYTTLEPAAAGSHYDHTVCLLHVVPSMVEPCRFVLEVLEAVAAAVGEDRVGVRLCPYNIWMDATDTVEAAVQKNVWLMQELNRRLPALAYVHMVRVLLQGFRGARLGH